MSNECKFCKWYRVGNVWCSMCMNDNNEYSGCSCVESDREPQECEDKEVEKC